jgi:hypothetical protein
MKNKRIKKEEEESEKDSDAPRQISITANKKKKVRGVSDVDLKKTEKLKIHKKIAGFSNQKDVDKRDLLSEIPSTVTQTSYRNTHQIEEIDLYQEYTDKIKKERNDAKEKFILELQKNLKV